MVGLSRLPKISCCELCSLSSRLVLRAIHSISSTSAASKIEPGDSSLALPEGELRYQYVQVAGVQY